MANSMAMPSVVCSKNAKSIWSGVPGEEASATLDKRSGDVSVGQVFVIEGALMQESAYESPTFQGFVM